MESSGSNVACGLTINLRSSTHGFAGTAIVTAVGRVLAACVLGMSVTASAAEAPIELPGVVVTAPSTAPRDIVDRDRAQRSPDVHWPAVMSLRSSEMFAHTGVDIYAPCEAVWNHLVQAERWPRWLTNAGKVKIKGGSEVLQRHTRFTWSGFDLPLDSGVFDEFFRHEVDSEVYECVPYSRLGWFTYGPLTLRGPLCATYQNWLLASTGPRTCRVTLEEVATGPAARYARGQCPEIMHSSHQRWLQELKRVSENRASNGF